MPDFELVFSDCSQVALISWWLFLPGEMCQATYAQGGGKDGGGGHSQYLYNTCRTGAFTILIWHRGRLQKIRNFQRNEIKATLEKSRSVK